MLAACVAVSWLLVRWLEDPLSAWIKAEYLPDTGDLPYRVIALAAAWAVGYALVSPPSDRRTPVSWGDPWRPLLHAYDNILRPTGVRPFLHGLVSAVPVNVLLICAGGFVAARVGYGWNGSESRDNFYRIAFVVLALGAFALSFVPARRR
jgi:hypothetical protein